MLALFERSHDKKPGINVCQPAAYSLQPAVLGRELPPLAARAEPARIGRYYATESMLVRGAAAGRYDAAATSSAGHETLFNYYGRLVRGEAAAERGDHAVF